MKAAAGDGWEPTPDRRPRPLKITMQEYLQGV
jgi:hypothetical protein